MIIHSINIVECLPLFLVVFLFFLLFLSFTPLLNNLSSNYTLFNKFIELIEGCSHSNYNNLLSPFSSLPLLRSFSPFNNVDYNDDNNHNNNIIIWGNLNSVLEEMKNLSNKCSSMKYSSTFLLFVHPPPLSV